MAAPTSRTLSWEQMVLEADPDYQRLNQRPVAYIFSNGRVFVARPDIYTSTST